MNEKDQGKKLPETTNPLIKLVNQVIDWLVLGLSESVVIAQATAMEPWLAWPGISWAFRHFVSIAATTVDTVLTERIDNVILRYQNKLDNNDYKDTLAELEKNTVAAVGKEEHAKALQDAKDKMDRLINRNR